MRLILLSISLVLISLTIQAQVEPGNLPTVDYNNKRTYNIGGITINGAESRDRNAIKSIAKLREGKSISIPGDAIPNAIKALMKLRLFDNVEIVQQKVEDDLIFLEINLDERPTLSRYNIKGEKKSKHADLTEIIDRTISKGSIVTRDVKDLLILKLEESYIENGYMDAVVTISESEDKIKANSVKLTFDIDKKERVKISDIIFLNNIQFNDTKLRRQMKDTKQMGTIFKKSKYVKDDFKLDKSNIIALYNKNGYRDARIVSDSIVRRIDGNLQMFITIDEGSQYYFRDIKWKGNSKYDSVQLSTVLGISEGDIYDPEILANRLSFSLDGRDVSSLYLDDGYLFFNVDPIETAVVGNHVDLTLQITEGAQATIANVGIAGNDRTHEHVIRRELRTRPGNKFSRSEIIRSQRSLMNLGYFNPETMDIQTPVNQQNGTVDVNYVVEETPSDQLELSAGYGGSSGLLGTLGITFNNFSLANIKDKSTWSPLPQGDGQKLSLRVQSNSRFFSSANFSFTEPWLGGKNPTSFTVGGVVSSIDQEILDRGKLSIKRLYAGIGTQLKWPDDFFSINTTVTTEWISLDNYFAGGFFVDDLLISEGNYKNFSITQSISRSSVADPIYPRRGSRVTLSLQFTPPYSLFRSDGLPEPLSTAEKEDVLSDLQKSRGSGAVISVQEQENAIAVAEASNTFNFLEYHKWNLSAEWYFNIFSKFVIATKFKFGFLGSYSDQIGISPFERFELGGDGLSNQTAGITGKEIISLRGYDVNDISQNNLGGAPIYDKLTIELRYPLSLNPSTSIYVSSFVQGGNSWSQFSEFSPFDVQRSAGFGVRVFLPMFGLLGFDYGWGFDQDPLSPNFENYGKFNIILGFEPE